MTLRDWEEIFGPLKPPSGEIARHVKLTFGNRRYYSYVGDDGSTLENLNGISCPFENWILETDLEDDLEESPSDLLVVQDYEKLRELLEKKGSIHAEESLDEGEKTITINAEQEWYYGMVADDDPRSAVSAVTYNFDEDDRLTGIELYIDSARLLEFVNDSIDDPIAHLTVEDLEGSISATCSGSSNDCTITGLPEGNVSGFWSLKVRELVEQYLTIDGVY